jgi:hypothetical protein
MGMIKTKMELKRAIQELEEKQTSEWALLKEQFHSTSKIIAPGNIAKIAFNELASTPSLKSSLLRGGIGLLAGFFGTKLLVGKLANPLSKMVAGSIMGVATSTQATKTVHAIKSIGSSVLRKMFKSQDVIGNKNGYII